MTEATQVSAPSAPTGDAKRPYRLGILGGTFDPPHRGHVALAQLCIDHLDLDELVWIPTGHSWQKGDHVTSAADRFAMTELAAASLEPGRAKVRVSRIEVDRDGPSYTIDTVRHLRDEYGVDTSMSWLMGADQLLRLHTWHGWEALFEQVHLCIATRPGFHLDELEGPVLAALQERLADTHLIQCSPSGHMWIDQTLAVDLSSTGLREHLAEGLLPDQTDDRLPAGVAHYIARHGLYRHPSPDAPLPE